MQRPEPVWLHVRHIRVSRCAVPVWPRNHARSVLVGALPVLRANRRPQQDDVSQASNETESGAAALHPHCIGVQRHVHFSVGGTYRGGACPPFALLGGSHGRDERGVQITEIHPAFFQHAFKRRIGRHVPVSKRQRCGRQRQGHLLLPQFGLQLPGGVRTRAVLCGHARSQLSSHLPVHRLGVELALIFQGAMFNTPTLFQSAPDGKPTAEVGKLVMMMYAPIFGVITMFPVPAEALAFTAMSPIELTIAFVPILSCAVKGFLRLTIGLDAVPFTLMFVPA